MTWAIAHSPTALVLHAALGLALVAVATGIAAHAARSRQRPVAGWSLLAGLLVIGAGFNGASFLDYAHNVSSLIMALLALAAIGCSRLGVRDPLSPERGTSLKDLGRCGPDRSRRRRGLTHGRE